MIKIYAFTGEFAELHDWCREFLQSVLSIPIDHENYEYIPPSRFHLHLFMAAVLGLRVGTYGQLQTHIEEVELFDLCDLCLGVDELFDPDVNMFYWSEKSLGWLVEWINYRGLWHKVLSVDELVNMTEKVAHEARIP